MERGIVSGQHGHEPYDGLELVRLTIPRRVYTQEHLAYVAGVVVDVHRARAGVPGLRITYEPEQLRFFQARFEPLAPLPAPSAPERRGLRARADPRRDAAAAPRPHRRPGPDRPSPGALGLRRTAAVQGPPEHPPSPP